MASMPIHNETDYALTAAMQQHIIQDAHEHFGEEVHSIRVQAGLERHAFNARTHEVRYAFSPTDFGLVPPMPAPPEPPRARRQPPRRDAEADHEFLPAPFEESEMEAEEPEPLVRSLDSLEAGDDEDEEALFIEDADVFRLDDQTEEGDDDEDEDLAEAEEADEAEEAEE